MHVSAMSRAASGVAVLLFLPTFIPLLLPGKTAIATAKPAECPLNSRWSADTGMCVPCPPAPVGGSAQALKLYNGNCKKYPTCCGAAVKILTSSTASSTVKPGAVKNASAIPIGRGAVLSEDAATTEASRVMSKDSIPSWVTIVAAVVGCCVLLLVPVVVAAICIPKCRSNNSTYEKVRSAGHMESGVAGSNNVREGHPERRGSSRGDGASNGPPLPPRGPSSSTPVHPVTSPAASSQGPTMTSQPNRGTTQHTYYATGQGNVLS